VPIICITVASDGEQAACHVGASSAHFKPSDPTRSTGRWPTSATCHKDETTRISDGVAHAARVCPTLLMPRNKAIPFIKISPNESSALHARCSELLVDATHHDDECHIAHRHESIRSVPCGFVKIATASNRNQVSGRSRLADFNAALILKRSTPSVNRETVIPR
jgi:hypothetical protein